MLTPKAVQRLEVGRGLAAEVSARLEAHRAWVYVYPIPDFKRSILVLEGGKEGRLIGKNDAPPGISGYFLRRVEVPSIDIDQLYDGKLMEAEHRAKDERVTVHSLTELNEKIAEWVEDPTTLREPRAAGYWLDLGPDLIISPEYFRWFKHAIRKYGPEHP